MIKKTALALASLVAGVSAQAQDAAVSSEGSALSVTVDVTYVSDYVFRGAKLAGASIQPSVEASYGNLYAGAWNSSSISDESVSEIDFYAGYGFDLTEKLSLDAGVTAYTYDGGSADDSIEAYVGASLDVLLTPSLYYYYDFDYEVSVNLNAWEPQSLTPVVLDPDVDGDGLVEEVSVALPLDPSVPGGRFRRVRGSEP